MVQRDKKKSLLFVNQYFPPDRASTGQLLAELTESLADLFDITVIAGRPSYSVLSKSKEQPAQPRKSGLSVKRVFNTSFARDNMPGRLCNYLTFMISAMIRTVFAKKHDLVITMSDPPTVNFIGWLLKKLKGSQHVQICQDLFPEIAIVLGQASNPLMLKLFSFLNRISQENADALVAISAGMKYRLLEKGLKANKIRIIENWIDTEVVTPEEKDNPFTKEHRLAGKFVVMHSGNVGLSQNLDLLLETARELSNFPDILFVIVGDGAQKSRLQEKALKEEIKNLVFIPYQEKVDIKYSLSAADLHFVSLKEGLSGFIVPSKIYGIMAAARPVIAALPKNDDTARFIEHYQFGVNSKESSSKAVAKAILYFYTNRQIIAQFGRRAREVVIANNSRKVITKQYADFIEKILKIGS